MTDAEPVATQTFKTLTRRRSHNSQVGKTTAKRLRVALHCMRFSYNNIIKISYLN